MILFLVGFVGGFLGSMLGLGGGIIVVPALNILGFNIKTAVAISIFSTIAVWSSASEKYIRSNMVDFKISVFLGSATTLGAILGSRSLVYLPEKVIVLIFVPFAILIIYSNLVGYRSGHSRSVITFKRLLFSYIFMVLSGFASAIMGIGAGIFKVFAMDRILNMPYKVSTATSVFLIGITTSSSALYYLKSLSFDPSYASFVSFGSLIGGFLGSRVMIRLPERVLRFLFSFVVSLLVIILLIKTFK
ncbi:MAG: sulfite exporter TauE/SafE family protein [Candidatus Caldipriscus sp.]|nr:sulfite exporter TauE/SafE family protein [Candidatus Caldipriscus sp.]